MNVHLLVLNLKNSHLSDQSESRSICNCSLDLAWMLHTPIRITTPASRFLHATFLARYVTLFARYDTLFVRYDTLLARYDTLLARYDTLLTRF
jgi:hypothetical protein